MGMILIMLLSLLAHYRHSAALSTAQSQSALDLHNTLRSNQNASNMQLMQWHQNLAEFAQLHADECRFGFSVGADRANLVPGYGWVGEGIYATNVGLYDTVVEDAIRAWYNESVAYNYENDTCASGGSCGQFRQLVWADTYLVGCGAHECTGIHNTNIDSGFLVVCNYAPGGNIGEQTPYTIGEACSNCPDDASNCVNNLCSNRTSPYTIMDDSVNTEPVIPPSILGISPRIGSISGGTKVTINGEGFSAEASNPGTGNRVYFIKDQYRIDCVVSTYYLSTTEIVCITSASPDGEEGRYNINLTINGTTFADRGGTVCINCYFDYVGSITPSIDAVLPLASTPGQLVTLRGRIFTINVDDAGEYLRISKIIVGGEICHLTDSETAQPYDSSITSSYGSITCQPSDSIGQNIASMNATLTMTYGNSITYLEDFSLDNYMRPYLYQTHAVITGVTPNEGSVNGGTTITVYGEYFDPNADDVEVLVGGIPCEIQSINSSMITCITGPSPPESKYYPGGRGLQVEWYKTTSDVIFNLDNFETFMQTNSPDLITYTEVARASSNEPTEFENEYFCSVYKGFVVPPQNGSYTFYVRSDDTARLYLSPNTSAEDAELIAEAPQYTREEWDYFSSQKSAKINLQGGKAYYMEAWHCQGCCPWEIEFGAKLHDTSITEQQAYGEHEQQLIQILSEIRKETHEILVNVEPAIVNITIEGTGSSFTLLNGLSESTSLTTDTSASDFQLAIIAIIDGTTETNLVVVKDTVDGQTTFQLIFLTDILNNTNLQVGDYDLASMNITITTIQMGKFPNDLKLSFAPRQSNTIPLPSNSSVIEEELYNMVLVSCIKTPTAGAVYWTHTYDNSPGRVWGTLDNTIDPMCGQYSLKNPTTVFRALASQDEVTQDIKEEIPWEIFNWLCFSYRGDLPLELKTDTYVTMPDGYRPSERIVYTLFPDAFPPSPGAWTRRCINLYEYFIFFSPYAGQAILFESNQVFFPVHDADFWIDEVTIQQGENQIIVDAVAARPNGTQITAISVTYNSLSYNGLSFSESRSKYFTPLYSYTVEYTVHDCMVGIPLLNHTAVNKDLITIQQTVGATSGVTGTFTIDVPQYPVTGLQTLQPILYNSSALELESWLENNYAIGDIEVTTGGTCNGRWWHIVWIERGGDQDLLVVNGSGLIQAVGDNASVTVETLIDGGVFIRPFRADMLRLPEEYPQVEVLINKIPSSCANSNCNFNFTFNQLPTVLYVSPSSGQAGTNITITGSNFHASNTGNMVTIGNTTCTVLEANETSITCIVGPNSAGMHAIKVTVSSIGSSSSNVTFQYILSLDGLYYSTNGSIGGGIVITILGMGFPEIYEQTALYTANEFAVLYLNRPEVDEDISNDFTISLNGSDCVVIESNYSYVRCLTGSHSAAVVDVTVKVSGTVAILSNTFEYSVQYTPLITEVIPNELSIYSNNTITIEGSGFGNCSSGSDVTVAINHTTCIIEYCNDTEIVCTVPPQPPGSYPVFVVVNEFGLAINTMAVSNEEALLYPFVVYELQVFEVYPRNGSILGGTSLTIYGAGFGSNQSDVEVIIGELPCEVIHTNGTRIDCVTSSITETIIVHPNISTYAWDPEVVVVQIGDTVEWSWMGLSLDLFQVENGSYAYDGQGFRSERIANGNFSYTFTQPGTYHYASDLNNFVQLRGLVIVEESSNVTFPILVKVNDYYAEYYITDNQTVNNSTTLQNPILLEPFTFAYSFYTTPVVTGIAPLHASIADEFTISGYGFSTTLTMNTVTIAHNYTCNITNASEISISCLLDPNAVLPINQPLAVEVDVHDVGNALVAINSVDNRSVTFYPIIANFTPTIGSFQGGLNLNVTGSGFDSYTTVTVGGNECPIEYVDYFNIICMIQAFDGDAEMMDEFSAEIAITTSGIQAICALENCTFAYSASYTPVIVDVYPTSFFGDFESSLEISFNGSLPPLPISVTIGMYPCEVTDVSNITSSINCTFEPVEAGTYTIMVVTYVGAAAFSIPSLVTSEGGITSLTPTTGSMEGGTILTINGYGFSNQLSNNDVYIGSQPCQIIYSNYSVIQCVTPASESADDGNYTVTVAVNQVDIDINNTYYNYGETPEIIEIDPTSGQEGDNVTITGSLFSDIALNNIVTIGSASCIVYEASVLEINCTLGAALAGTYVANVLVYNIGTASGSVSFEYLLSVSILSLTQGSFAGRNILTMYGTGFEPVATFVKICNQLCAPTNNPPSLTMLECEVPAFEYTGSDVTCNVTVSSVNSMVVLSDVYTYRVSLTPHVTSLYPTMGGTAGGTTITIEGSGFMSSNTTVSIGDRENECVIIDINDTTIECQTGDFGRSIKAEILVEVDGNFAITYGHTFYYIDLWSSNYTWGGQLPPEDGDFIVVPRGQTVAIDVDTAILSFLLIQGGTVMFLNERNVSLHTHYILITDNGTLQAGTEEEPFTNKLEIVLYGNPLSTELPVYGAKTLAVRNGILDLHGKVVNVTWTRLDVTANPADTMITLQEPVPWEVGGKIIIVSTSYDYRENEEVEITDIDPTGTILTIDPPLQYEHISVKQTISGKFVDASAEVGYLTRNIIIRGDKDTGASDQFGVHILLHPPTMNERTITGRIEYVEVTHAGQAFRLGRHPVNFHRVGDLTGSYVKGCAIYDSFNGAVVVNDGSNLMIENNVAYKIKGNAFVMRNSIATVAQYNLGVGVIGSSSLFNADISPAAFLITHPNNTVKGNAAAGGSYYGYWYYMNNDGFSSIQDPRYAPFGEFTDNTAHSLGHYAVEICPEYFPKVDGSSNGPDEPAILNGINSYKNRKGVVSCRTVGAVQINDSVFLDEQQAGVDVRVVSGQWGEQGPLVQDVLIVGHSDINSNNSIFCTVSGSIAPCSYYLTVSNVTFVNFDRAGCSAISSNQGCGLRRGYLTRYKNISLIESPNLVTWQLDYEHVHKDLDGSLTGIVNGSLLPYSALLPSDNCSTYETNNTHTNTSLCDGSIDFVRLQIYGVNPSSLRTSTIYLTNIFGTADIAYETYRSSGPTGFIAVVPKGYEYLMEWENGDHISNISYYLIISGLYEDEYFWITHNYSQPVDKVVINGVEQNSSTVFPDPAFHSTGTWYGTNDTECIEESEDFTNNTSSTSNCSYITYLVKGQPNGRQHVLHYQTYRCFYENCIVPTPPPTLPPGVPNVTQDWSDSSTWESGQLPQEGESITITSLQYVIVDIPIPRLATITIYGALELSDELDHVIEADTIIIAGGRLVVGWPDMPFNSTAVFTLYGSKSSPEVILPPFGPVLGAKAIGVFGQLILHGQGRDIIWTHLAETALPGSDTIEVIDPPDWYAGDEIVIASTSFEMLHTEKFQILNISEGTITLNDTLKYKHLGEETVTDGHAYIQRAEVGLLTRNIKIQSGDAAVADDESFGCRILVGSYTNEYGVRLVGSAQIDGVEIAHCGQEGYPDSFDPRYSFAVLNNRIGATETTYIRRSSIHDGYNSGIGVFGSSGVTISDNVIHRTVGPSVVLEGSDHILTSTMATVALFPGTYQGINDPQNFEWTANFKLTDTTNLTLLGNAAAGGGKVGFHVDGEPCDSPIVNSTPRWEANVAHSTLHGIYVGYDDGLDTCLQLSYFTIYSCYHYGIFTYSRAGVYMENNVLVDNNAALLLNVFSPSALTHETSTKTIVIKNTTIVGASSHLTSEDDAVVPEVSSHSLSFYPMLAPGGGHIGIILSSFLSGRGRFPLDSWPSITSYPAISGSTTLDGVTFINFASRYSKRDFALSSNPLSEDCQHPVFTYNAKLINVDTESLCYVHEPDIASINPADCVDLDCDGQKHILIKDVDGSLLNKSAGGTIISRAEFEWGGNRGLGDDRIPTILLTDPVDGTFIPVDDIFPLKGIVRGVNGSNDSCDWMPSWNAYSCSGLNHLMFVFESLDDDSEVRRLSPFALAADGFIDILNGPKDHGWCGGYTCQERISTFYGIIAPGLNYEIALSSTNPQNMRFHLLNAEENDTIRIAFIYTNPQRLDVYYGDTYVHPTNVRIENGETVYDPKDPNLPDDQFQPTINDQPGANFYERSDKRLYFILRGNTPITIKTTPVIQIALNLAPVTVDAFFEENLVSNLATLLGIDQSVIQIVEVISETSRRKRQTEATIIYIQIGDPISVSNASTNSSIMDFETLENITTIVALVIQTGELERALGVLILFAEVQPPEPSPVDFTGGVRATNTTGGPQPGEVDDDALTYAEYISNLLSSTEVTPVTLTIPAELQIVAQPVGGIEGLSLTPFPIVALYDRDGEIITNLGIGDPWVVSISLISNSANSVQLLPSSETVFTGGYANLTNFSISHPGNGYILMFNITDPPVGFTAQTAPFDVATRELVIAIVESPVSGNTTLPLYPYPTVELLDSGILERVSNLGWRGRRWFARLKIQSSDRSAMQWNTEFDTVDAFAIFTSVIISQPGQYLMEFSAYTNPDSEIMVVEATKTITIKRLPSAIMRFVLIANFLAVIGNNQELFVQSVTTQLIDLLPQVTVYNVSIFQGSIVVTFNVQSESANDVQDAIDTFLNTDLEIYYNGSTYVTTERTAQFVSADDNEEDNDEAHDYAIIIASAIGGSFLLAFQATSLVVIGYWCYKKRNSKVWRIQVAACDRAHDTTKSQEMQEMRWQATQAFVEENHYDVDMFTSSYGTKMRKPSY